MFRKWTHLGCSYVIGMGLLCIALLLVNGIVVRSFLAANARMIEDLRWEQAINYFVPVLLVFVEFWIYDLFRGRR